ncbi:dihydrofolate reductase family protein [Quadrisphaera sp. DSM 44207]|uniref:dihydrofolate reductase family protein n=1 Tax=Quadrisphaera sp. DSM 44207 TaxID=1881057 RepID=UPI0015A48E88|nr:dihydrofolate reductase family protein [Quadrisphaera sp. DSM 44207]
MAEVRTGRTVVGSVCVALDGRTPGPGGDLDADWAVPHVLSDAARELREQLSGSATTVLVGGEDYEGLREAWQPLAEDSADGSAAAAADLRDRAFARWLDEVEKIVVSPSLTEPGWRNAWVLGVSPTQVTNQLRRQRGGDVLVLGGALVRGLLAVDALDRLAVLWCPEVLGSGERLFDDGLPRSRWSLVSSAVSDTGAVATVYDRER